VDKGLIWAQDHCTGCESLIRDAVPVVDIVRIKPFIFYHLCDTSILDVVGLLGAAASDILPSQNAEHRRDSYAEG
jgi:hypothetical protein